MESAFCRYCSDPLPFSKKEELCKACGRSSLPLTEEGISISSKETQKKLSAKNAVLVDVRWPDEVKAAHIEGSIHIPLSQLEKRTAELPKNRQIVVHCHHGNRSRYATIMLLCNGFTDVKNMVGGIDEWSREVDSSVLKY